MTKLCCLYNKPSTTHHRFKTTPQPRMLPFLSPHVEKSPTVRHSLTQFPDLSCHYFLGWRPLCPQSLGLSISTNLQPLINIQRTPRLRIVLITQVVTISPRSFNLSTLTRWASAWSHFRITTKSTAPRPSKLTPFISASCHVTGISSGHMTDAAALTRSHTIWMQSFADVYLHRRHSAAGSCLSLHGIVKSTQSWTSVFIQCFWHLISATFIFTTSSSTHGEFHECQSNYRHSLRPR
jgi:hypothetical protein